LKILAVVVLVLGFLVVWGGLTQPDTADIDQCPPFDETQGYTLEPQWWPPGTLRCDVTDGGEVVATMTTFPWRDYATVVLLALAVAVFRPLSPLRWGASLLLVAAAGAVFFVGFDL
jgi:hypothetical protein